MPRSHPLKALALGIAASGLTAPTAQAQLLSSGEDEWKCAVFLCASDLEAAAREPKCGDAFSRITPSEKPECPGVTILESRELATVATQSVCADGQVRIGMDADSLLYCPDSKDATLEASDCLRVELADAGGLCADPETGLVTRPVRAGDADAAGWYVRYDVGGQEYDYTHTYD